MANDSDRGQGNQGNRQGQGDQGSNPSSNS